MPRPSLPGKPFGNSSGMVPGSRRDRSESEWSDDQLYNELSRHLSRSGVYIRLSELDRSDLAGRTDADIAAELVGPLLRPVRLIDDTPTRQEPLDGDSDYVEGRAVHSKWLQLTWSIEGDGTWLTCWPWKASRVPADPLDFERSMHREPDLPAHATIEPFRVEPGVVHSYVQVYEDELPIRDTRDQRITQRVAYLHEYLAAHAEAVTVCDGRVQGEVASHVAERRRDLGFIDAILDGLTLEVASVPNLELDPIEEPSEPIIELRLPARRLTDASFESVIRVIESWRTVIEAGALHLHDLSEDALTFTLLPTLQNAFGVANHGTFVHSGATDITIPARQLAAIQGVDLDPDESDVFVAEAKRGGGSALAAGARDQVDRYLGRRTYHACLIFYITADAFDQSFGSVLLGLRAHDQFLGNGASLGTVPVLLFRDPLARIQRRVAVVGVSLPRVRNQQDERSRRAQAQDEETER